jgi:gliding motility-associated-like protein
MQRKLLLILLSLSFSIYFSEAQDNFESPSARMIGDIETPVFRKNNGQWDGQILYRLSSGHTSIAFYKNKIQFGLRKVKSQKIKKGQNPDNVSYAIWDMVLENSQTNLSLQAEGIKDSKINYFRGNSGQNIKAEDFEKLTYKNVYPNIDLVFYLDSRQTLKYDFIVNPGGNFEDIKLNYQGIKKLKLDLKGNLQITTPWGNKIKEGKPISWQIVSGKKVPVSINYKVNGNILTYESNSKLNNNATLVIDPMMLDWSTYFYGKVGASGWGYTYIMDMDIDKFNNVYVTGFTNEKYPMRVGTYDTIPNSTTFWDGFVAKVSVNGDSLLYFSYIGGSNWSYILSLSVNAQMQPVISGVTYAKDFPVTSNAYDKSTGSGTGYRGFITKFSSDFKTLVFSTYFGNSNSWGTVIQSMGLTKGGDVIFTGQTNANDLPVTVGCVQKVYGGGANDAFLARLSADGSKLVYSTYFGGTGDDKATDLSINASEDVYIVGSTANSNFPLTTGAKGPFKYTNSDNMDGFVARIQFDGKKLLWSKMMGGTQMDYFEGLYVNDNDELYIAGFSNSSDFYTTANAVQPVSKGGYDHVVVKMNKSGTNVFFSTYLGGSGDDYYYAGSWWTSNIRITANVKDEPIIGGVTKSTNYPVTFDAIQPQNNATSAWGWATNLAITKLSYDGSKILYGTYYGGSEWEWTTVLKVKKISCMSSILYGGITGSKDYPTTNGVFREKAKTTSGFSYSGFMSRFRDTLYTEPIEFKDNFVECDLVYEVLDAKNRGASYLWSDGSTKKNLIVTDTGKYWVMATYGCDTVSDTIHLSLEYSPKLSWRADTTLCNNSTGLMLDAQNDTIIRSYLWSTADTTQTINVKTPGTYFVKVSTPNCGDIADTTEVKFLKVPDLKLIRDSLFCDKVDWNLKTDSLGPGTIYKWSTKDTLYNTSINKIGTYSLKVSNYCGEDSISFKAELLKTPKVNLPNDTVVCDQFTLKYKVGQAGNQELYNWFDPIKKVYYGTDDSITINTTTLLGVTIENQCGIAKDSLLVEQKFTPVISLGNDSVYCNSINKLLKIGLLNNSESYLWNSGATASQNTITSPGKYWAKITNLCGSASDTIEFIQKNSLSIDLGNDTVFCNAVIKNLDITQSDPDAVYAWYNGSSLPSITVSSPTKVFASIKNLCSTVSDTVVYSLLTTPQLNLGKDYVFCDVITPVNLSIGKANNTESFLWSNGATSSSNSYNTNGKHWANITNKCGMASDTFLISLVYSPKVDIGPDTALCGNFSFMLDAGNPGLSYLWEPSQETTQTIFANKQTIYKVKVTDAFGCFGSDAMLVKDDCKSKWLIPNAFSPNGDMINDTYLPVLVNVEDYSLAIYNTWGERVFYTNNTNESWNGEYYDKTVPQGNYLYIINFRSSEDKRWYNLKGSITVLR